MAHDLHRAAFALVCVFAVVFGASLFPATGFGANPVPAGDGGAGSGPGDGPASTDAVADEPTTATDSTNDANRETTATDTAAPETSTASSANSESTTATTTRSAAYDRSSSGGLKGALLAFGSIVLFATVAVVAAAVGFGRHHRRRNPGEWDLPDAPHLRVLAYVRRVPQTSLAFVLFAGANAPSILDQLGSWTGNASSGLAAVASGLGRAGATLGSGLLKAPAGFLAGVGALGRGVGSLTLSLPSMFSGTGSVFGGGDARPGSDPRSGGGTEAATAEPEPPEPPSSVREAWERLQDDLGVSGDDGRTPGEIARRAVDRGVPTDAVRALTRTFRDVRYGGRPDDGERASVARDAYQRIKTALDGDSS